jgi:hypothetical protein
MSKKHEMWIGFGIKTGGMLAVAGSEATVGHLYKVGNTTESVRFSRVGLRLGIGLGGSVGAVVMLVFNAPNIWQLHRMRNDDWGLNLALGKNWTKVGKALKNAPFYSRIVKLAKSANSFRPQHIDAAGELMEYAYNAFEVASVKKGSPKIVTFDTPIGAALEVSINKSFGRIELG